MHTIHHNAGLFSFFMKGYKEVFVVRGHLVKLGKNVKNTSENPIFVPKLITMLQRVQSLFLLGVTISFALLFFFAFCVFVTTDTEFVYSIYGVETLGENAAHHYLLPFITAFVAVFSIVIIFMYRNRKRQMRLTLFNTLFILAFLLTVSLLYLVDKGLVNSFYPDQPNAIVRQDFKLGFVLPVIGLIFNLLAYRGIKKDEELVRSADRIR